MARQSLSKAIFAIEKRLTAVLEGIDVVFHQAAYGGYMPQIAKYVHVNSLGTAQMLEVIRENKLPVRKIIVASSQAVYSEGAATCPTHGLVFPTVRPSNNYAEETGQFIARSVTRSRKACRLRRTRRLAAKPFMA